MTERTTIEEKVSREEALSNLDKMVILKSLESESKGIRILFGLNDSQEMNPVVQITDATTRSMRTMQFSWETLLDLTVKEHCGEGVDLTQSVETEKSMKWLEELVNAGDVDGNVFPMATMLNQAMCDVQNGEPLEAVEKLMTVVGKITSELNADELVNKVMGKVTEETTH